MPALVAVTVIGGYLGAGKTTLLNRILRDSGSGTAVIVNDFGSVNIDERLIESVDGDVVALTNGCICCTLADGFIGALETIRTLQPPPTRLVIEASGVSDPRQVAAYGTITGFELDGVIGLVDAEAVRRQATDRFVGDLVVAQLAAADLLVLNKVDLVDEEQLDATRCWLRQQAPDAVVIEARHADVPLPLLLGSMVTATTAPTAAGAELAPRDSADHARADDLFETWTFESDEPISAGRLDGMLVALPVDVVRLKGLVRTSEEPERQTIVQAVGRRSTRTLGGAWSPGPNQIVAIGHRGAIHSGWLDRHLR